MLEVGIAVLVVSIIVERAVTIRGARRVNELGGDWNRRELVYAWEGGPSRMLSLVALLAYAGIVAGLVLIAVSFL
jgi:TRAP-type uncharacterized transport system fused permease subunit